MYPLLKSKKGYEFNGKKHNFTKSLSQKLKADLFFM